MVNVTAWTAQSKHVGQWVATARQVSRWTGSGKNTTTFVVVNKELVAWNNGVDTGQPYTYDDPSILYDNPGYTYDYITAIPYKQSNTKIPTVWNR